MFFPHHSDKEVSSLSYRIRDFTKRYDSYNDHKEDRISLLEQNFQISSVLSKIIQTLEIISVKPAQLILHVQEYNSVNKTPVSYEQYYIRSWIRLINEEIVFSQKISAYLSTVISQELRGENVDLFNNDPDFVNCIKQFYNKFYYDKKKTISKVQLERVLSFFTNFSVDFFIDNSILRSTENGDYEWTGAEYTRYLKNEITQKLWKEIVDQEQTLDSFRVFIRLLSRTQIWPSNLSHLLTEFSVAKLLELCSDFLLTEDDLKNSELEMQKVMLDGLPSHGITADIAIRDFTFSGNQGELLRNIKSLPYYYADIFAWQGARNIYANCLSILMANDLNTRQPYTSTILLLKTIDRPFLIYGIFDRAKKNAAQLIPFLLDEDNLRPLAFRLLDEIEINPEICRNQGNEEKNYSERLEIKNALWLEAFDLFLKKIVAKSDYSNGCQELAEILYDLGKKTFSVQNSNRFIGSQTHQAYRKRYDSVLKSIGNLRTNNNVYASGSSIKPRLFPSLIPKVYEAFIEIKSLLPENPFLRLETEVFDLIIELSRIADIPLLKDEASNEEEILLRSTQDKMKLFLFEKLKNYFSLTSLDIYSYNHKYENKPAKRGVSDFGIEIVDWGYLFLKFDKRMISKLNSSFKNGLVFDIHSTEEKYSDQNKEQKTKINTYVRLVLLALHMIKHKQSKYIVSIKGRDKTVKELEALINFYAIKYSIDNLPKSRMDIFEENFSWANDYIYKQPLSKLLYLVINQFETIDKVEFVNKFIKNSKDLGKMLSIHNNIENPEIKKMVAVKLKNINVDEYINSRFTIDELEDAVLEANNSEEFFETAEPLLKKIEEHFKRINESQINVSNFAFKSKLRLAYRRKDLDSIQKLQLPKTENTPFNHQDSNNEIKKDYYVALHYLNHDKKYDLAIDLLQKLLLRDPRNIDYVFHLHKAKVYKAMLNG